MGSSHTEYWVARPTHSTGFGFASVSAVREAFELAFTNASGSSGHNLDIRLRKAVPIDRRYELSISAHADGSLRASMLLDDVIVADATASPYSSS